MSKLNFPEASIISQERKHPKFRKFLCESFVCFIFRSLLYFSFRLHSERYLGSAINCFKDVIALPETRKVNVRAVYSGFFFFVFSPFFHLNRSSIWHARFISRPTLWRTNLHVTSTPQPCATECVRVRNKSKVASKEYLSYHIKRDTPSDTLKCKPNRLPRSLNGYRRNHLTIPTCAELRRCRAAYGVAITEVLNLKAAVRYES